MVFSSTSVVMTRGMTRQLHCHLLVSYTDKLLYALFSSEFDLSLGVYDISGYESRGRYYVFKTMQNSPTSQLCLH